MTQDVYCSIIHGGLAIDFVSTEIRAQHCCLRNTSFPIDTKSDFWNDKKFIPLRQRNSIEQEWDRGCANCWSLEKSGMDSFRTGMNRGLGIEGQTNLKGPSFINLMFDISCNLACRTCGPQLSTYWQHHLRENKEWQGPISSPKRANDVIAALDQLDLTELKQVVLTGGETLLGNSYWEVVQWLVDHVPNAKDQLTICFQTNGTQSIPQKYFETIARTKLVKLHISIDAVDERFEYLRWPARWQALEQNIFSIRESCPSNVMFVVEETISIFNLFYSRETKSWCQNNFSSNREGDIVNHSRHLAHGIYSLDNCTDEYAQAIAGSNASDLIPQHRKENPVKIISMLDQIKKIDGFRKQSFANTFPEVFEFYKRYW